MLNLITFEIPAYEKDIEVPQNRSIGQSRGMEVWLMILYM